MIFDRFQCLKLIPVFLCTTSSLMAAEMDPWQPAYTQMNHGGVGLIQMPTARFNQDGTMAFNYQDSEEYRFWSTSLQLFPWMETTMRYSDVRTKLYSDDPGFSGDQSYKDKGIDAKFRLWSESRYLPQVALGVRDFGGTGLFESEFLVLSKRWQNIDAHLGVGWGYLAEQATLQTHYVKFLQPIASGQLDLVVRAALLITSVFLKGLLLYMVGLNIERHGVHYG